MILVLSVTVIGEYLCFMMHINQWIILDWKGMGKKSITWKSRIMSPCAGRACVSGFLLMQCVMPHKKGLARGDRNWGWKAHNTWAHWGWCMHHPSSLCSGELGISSEKGWIWVFFYSFFSWAGWLHQTQEKSCNRKGWHRWSNITLLRDGMWKIVRRVQPVADHFSLRKSGK